ncbi:MAG: hypothetical protein H0X27_03990 [Caulobacteraceae bacterium]|nr:hypothetical protein [Caulobacteraceae bacterium]
MSEPPPPHLPSLSSPADQALLGLLRAQNLMTRTALCTLARRGVAFRGREPDRARGWLEALDPHPLYKAGQFLFDLMEWEDFMLDGEPPGPDDTSARALAARLLEVLGLPPTVQSSPPPSDETLPNLDPGFHLYRDVVLGLLDIGLGAVTSDDESAS